jgi:SAM-dependent methyltransferase
VVTAAGERWHDGGGYESYIGRWSRRVAERFLAWLEVRYGAEWLDVGCGTGVLTRTILEFADPLTIAGVDPAPHFLTTARTSTRDTRVTFVEGEAEALPLEPRSVDVVVSGLVLNFVSDLPVALQDMRRVTRPEGTIAGYVWDYAGEMQLLRRFWDAAIELDPKAAELDEGRRFPIAQPTRLAEAFRAAGLRDVDTTAIEVPTAFADFADYWSPFLGGVGPAPGYVATLDAVGKQRLQDRLDATLPRDSDGSIDLVARAWAVRGTV